MLTELAADGMPFEGIHVIGGRPDDFAVFNDRGYVTELQRSSLFIARFEGCPAELVLPPGALVRESIYYRYGLFSKTLLSPEPRALARMAIKRDTPVIDGRVHVPLAGRPCGQRTCESADSQGRLRANVNRDHPTVSCESPVVTAPVPHGTQTP